MDYEDWQDQVRSLASLAREQLVKARLARYQMEIAQEFQQFWGDSWLDEEYAFRMRDRAKLYRSQAQVTLRQAEIYNGFLYLKGCPVVTLKYALNGYEFRKWEEYRTLKETHRNEGGF